MTFGALKDGMQLRILRGTLKGRMALICGYTQHGSSAQVKLEGDAHYTNIPVEDFEPDPAADAVDVAEMLMIVVSNVNGGDWRKQTPEWQAAARKAVDEFARICNNRGSIMKMDKSGRQCDCSAADMCPLGRVGSQVRCTADELRERGVIPVRHDGSPAHQQSSLRAVCVKDAGGAPGSCDNFAGLFSFADYVWGQDRRHASKPHAGFVGNPGGAEVR